jgi:cell division septation protein DedD
MSDEGFHEIQLNGKQLVFLFMAATVVAVVIFLCGVMVGRGVPTRAGSAIDASERADLDPTAVLQEFPAAQTMSSTGNAPVAVQETLTYPSLLEDPTPPAETLKPPVEPAREVPAPVAPRPASAASAKPAAVAAKPVVIPATPAAVTPTPVAVAPRSAPVTPPPAVVPTPAVAPKPVAETPVASGQVVDARLAEPPGTGFVVQVAAVRQRAEANTIARRLSTKGYPAFVTTAGANFRVRVGKYTDRREAESVAGRLEKEEQFKPWITR